MNERSCILQEADGLINGDRARDYGTPQENFDRIARVWSVILGIDVTAHEVALCMAGLKLARLANGPHRDSYVDGAGYLALAGELAMVDDPGLPLG
jgi:hypothetical protein